MSARAPLRMEAAPRGGDGGVGAVAGLSKRYFYKLMGNVATFGSRVVVQAVVPRALGPASYGDFLFLTNFFTRLVGFLSMGSAMALNNKVSQRPTETGLTTFYACFVLLTSSVTVAFVGVSYVLSVEDWLWPGQARFFVYAAAVWAIFVWGGQVVNGVADACGLTVKSEMARVWLAPLTAGLAVILMVLGVLNQTTVFVYYYLTLGCLSALLMVLLERAGHRLFDRVLLAPHRIQSYVHEFYVYCHPLIVYSAVSFVTGVGDRWILQVFSGSVEQGYFGLAAQIGAVCFLFTGTMTPLISREYSVAAGQHDIALMAKLFRRYVPVLYAVAAFLAVFVLSQADRVVQLFGGAESDGAVIPMAIMALYPIHQTYGQLSGAVFYATGQTALYRNIGVLSMVLGLAVAYVVIAPRSAGGLDTGAIGLAVKTVILQIVTVNVQLYYNARLLGLRFSRYLAHQVACVATLAALGWVARLGVQWIDPQLGVVATLLVSSVLYTAAIAGVALAAPSILGLTRRDASLAIGTAKRVLTAR